MFGNSFGWHCSAAQLRSSKTCWQVAGQYVEQLMHNTEWLALLAVSQYCKKCEPLSVLAVLRYCKQCEPLSIVQQLLHMLSRTESFCCLLHHFCTDLYPRVFRATQCSLTEVSCDGDVLWTQPECLDAFKC